MKIGKVLSTLPKLNNSTPRSTFVLYWVLVSVSCFLFALVAAVATYLAIAMLIESGIAPNNGWIENVLFFIVPVFEVLLLGAITGFAQWHLAFQGRFSKWVWIVTNAITSFTGILAVWLASFLYHGDYLGLVYVQPGTMSGLDDKFIVSQTWFIAVIIVGLSFGLASGIPQWLVLRRYFHNAWVWLGSSIIGGLAIFGSFILLVFTIRNATLVPCISCCLSPIILSTISGIVLYRLLHYPKVDTSGQTS
ncbi:MAG: hypothetical protein ABI947_29145 [Chloroflexota bacterium]